MITDTPEKDALIKELKQNQMKGKRNTKMEGLIELRIKQRQNNGKRNLNKEWINTRRKKKKRFR